MEGVPRGPSATRNRVRSSGPRADGSPRSLDIIELGSGKPRDDGRTVLPSSSFTIRSGLPNEVVEATYPGVAGVQPEFEPGDAMLFDQLCVHRTGYLPGMREPRLGIECWFFAPSAMPADYSGLLV